MEKDLNGFPIIKLGEILECIEELCWDNIFHNDFKFNKNDLYKVIDIPLEKDFISYKVPIITMTNGIQTVSLPLQSIPYYFKIYNAENSTYIHLKTNNEYKVIKDIKIKSPETGKWVEGVLYKSLKTGEEFARSKESFDSHFKKL